MGFDEMEPPDGMPGIPSGGSIPESRAVVMQYRSLRPLAFQGS